MKFKSKSVLATDDVSMSGGEGGSINSVILHKKGKSDDDGATSVAEGDDILGI
jgi:hypothetical protein